MVFRVNLSDCCRTIIGSFIVVRKFSANAAQFRIFDMHADGNSQREQSFVSLMSLYDVVAVKRYRILIIN